MVSWGHREGGFYPAAMILLNKKELLDDSNYDSWTVAELKKLGYQFEEEYTDLEPEEYEVYSDDLVPDEDEEAEE